jgi:hypothetical protein
MISTPPAERVAEKLRRKTTSSPTPLAAAENGRQIRRFSALKLTGCNTANCYNFETIASSAPDFLAIHYHHY